MKNPRTRHHEPEYKTGGNMKGKSVVSCLIILVLMISSAHAATSATSSDSTSNTAQDAASLVYVSSVKIDPEVFYPYEQGTITVTLTNSGYIFGRALKSGHPERKDPYHEQG